MSEITQNAGKPPHIKLFWWLSVFVVAYWITGAVHFLVNPGDEYLATLSHLPARLRQQAFWTDELIRLVPALFWSGLTIWFAWGTAFQRQKWARWAYTVQFLVRTVVAIIVLGTRHNPETAIFSIGNATQYITPLLTLVAIVLVFSNRASQWLKASA